MLFDVPNSGSCVVANACQKVPIFEEYYFGYLLFVSFVAMHKFEYISVPDPDELLFFVRYDY